MSRVPPLHFSMRLTPNRFILLTWSILLVLSFPLFWMLASYPGIMLRIEEGQPAIAIRQAQDLIKAGRVKEAVAQYKRGLDFFTKLYEEHGLESHLIHRITALIGIADAYVAHGSPRELELAVEYYRQAAGYFENGNHGHWYLSEGKALQKLEQYPESIAALDSAIRYGRGFTALLAHYERGRSRLMVGDRDPACDDLFVFVRSQYRSLTEEQWQEFVPLQGSENPKKHFVLALMYRSLNNPAQAVEEITTFLKLFPDNRDAQYILSSLTDTPLPVPDDGDIPLTRVMPPQDSSPYLLTDHILNVYLNNGGLHTLSLMLSTETTGTKPPQVIVEYNGLEQAVLLIASDQPQVYSTELELTGGKNALLLFSTSASMNEDFPKILLYSIQLEKGLPPPQPQ